MSVDSYSKQTSPQVSSACEPRCCSCGRRAREPRSPAEELLDELGIVPPPPGLAPRGSGDELAPTARLFLSHLADPNGARPGDRFTLAESG